MNVKIVCSKIRGDNGMLVMMKREGIDQSIGVWDYQNKLKWGRIVEEVVKVAPIRDCQS